MAKSVNKFIVKLSDVSEFKPKLAVAVSAVKDKKKTFIVKIVHPNFKVGEDGKPLLVDGKKVPEIIHEEEFVSDDKDPMKGFVEALNYGKQLMERPDIQEIARNTKYVEQLFIPQGKRGKMKLKTKDSDEAKSEREALRIASDEAPDMEMDDLDEIEASLEDEDAPKVKKEKPLKIKKEKSPKKEKKSMAVVEEVLEVVSKPKKEAKVSKPAIKHKETVKATVKNKNKKVEKKTKAVAKVIKNKKKKNKR